MSVAAMQKRDEARTRTRSTHRASHAPLPHSLGPSQTLPRPLKHLGRRLAPSQDISRAHEEYASAKRELEAQQDALAQKESELEARQKSNADLRHGASA